MKQDSKNTIIQNIQFVFMLFCVLVLLLYVELFVFWNHAKYTCWGIIGLLLATFFWNLCCKYPLWKIDSYKKIAPWSLFVVCFISRLVYCLWMNPYIIQVSDFALVLRETISGEFVDKLLYYKKFMHKIFYPLFLHMLGVDSQKKLFVVQCIVVSIIPVLLFFIGKLVCSRNVGFLAGCIYIIWPFQLIYITVATEEHLSALITVVLVYLILQAIKKIEACRDENTQKSWLYNILNFSVIGFFCGLSNLFKDWGGNNNCCNNSILYFVFCELYRKTTGNVCDGSNYRGCYKVVYFGYI